MKVIRPDANLEAKWMPFFVTTKSSSSSSRADDPLCQALPCRHRAMMKHMVVERTSNVEKRQRTMMRSVLLDTRALEVFCLKLGECAGRRTTPSMAELVAAGRRRAGGQIATCGCGAVTMTCRLRSLSNFVDNWSSNISILGY